jgi:hypothetical protein
MNHRELQVNTANAVIDGMGLKKEPHWLEENRSVLVGKRAEGSGMMEVTLSVKSDGTINMRSKITKEKLGGLRHEELMKFDADFNKEGKLVKVNKFKAVAEYSDYYDRKRIEGEVGKVLQSDLGKQWVEDDLKNIGRRVILVKPLG